MCESMLCPHHNYATRMLLFPIPIALPVQFVQYPSNAIARLIELSLDIQPFILHISIAPVMLCSSNDQSVPSIPCLSYATILSAIM